MEKAGPFIGHPASGGQGVTWSSDLEGAGLSGASPWDLRGASPWDLRLPQGPHLTCVCACMCVWGCVYACPGGLVTPGTSVCRTVLTSLGHVCAHAHVCVRVRTCPRLPPFLSPPKRCGPFPGFVSAAGVGQGPDSPDKQPVPKFPERSELTKTR